MKQREDLCIENYKRLPREILNDVKRAILC